jgi:cytochrome d ubiquinol oxidase subunit I
LSFLAHGDPAAAVTGLDDIPRANWPPVAAVHLAFQVMVAIGGWLAVLALWAAALWWRGRLFHSRLFLRAMVLSTPLGFVALEAGWMVTELGRQPWIIQGVMRTSEAVTPMPGLGVPFVLFTLIYLALGSVVIVLIRRTVRETVSRGTHR